MERQDVSVIRDDRSQSAPLVELLDDTHAKFERWHRSTRQWTILASGSSMMSVAPASLSAGMSVLITDLATTVSTA